MHARLRVLNSRHATGFNQIDGVSTQCLFGNSGKSLVPLIDVANKHGHVQWINIITESLAVDLKNEVNYVNIFNEIFSHV